MIGRRAFVGSGIAFAAAMIARAAAAVETSTAGNRNSDDGRLTLDAVEVLIATLPRARIVWKPPSAFPPLVPFAYYPGRGAGAANPNDATIWLNPDHPELVSPRRSRLTDEIPLSTELLLASVDVRPPGTPSVGLERLDPDRRRLAAADLAARVAVVARFTPYPAVDDAEFARRWFAFAVLRQMTLELGGLDPDRIGRDRPELEAAIRPFVLATASAQPEGNVRSSYEAARAKDEAMRGNSWAARRAFAAPYVDQVAALLGK